MLAELGMILDVVLTIPVGVAEDGAIGPDGVAQRIENGLRAAHDLADAAQGRMNEHRIAWIDAERLEISRQT